MSGSCSLLVGSSQSPLYPTNELKAILETGSDEEKIQAMKQTISHLLNGDPLPPLLMTVIRFVMPSRDAQLKKLVMIYLEVVPKTGTDGKLLSEMILVCNFLRNDLIHPNEYIRGSALRLISKINEEEILLPLIPSIRQNLEHRHAYVRRNAVMAVFYLYKNFEHLIPDATDLVLNFLAAETDPSAKRNAFVMLYHCDQDKAFLYLSDILDQVASFGETLQIIVVQLIRKTYRRYPDERARHVRCIYTLLNASSNAVRFEAASTLILLSTAAPAIRAAASTLINIICTQSDNNIKLVVLDKLSNMKHSYKPILQELIMDLLCALAAPNLDIRRKTLELCADLISSRNVDEVIQCLRKEITKSQAHDAENGPEYRQLLIQAIHSCAIRFPEVASNVVLILMDFLSDANVDSAVDVVLFVREVVELHPDLRQELLHKLASSLRMVRASPVFASALWILGEYSHSKDDVDVCLTAIKKVLGEPPFTPSDKPEEDGEEESKGESTNQAQIHGFADSAPSAAASTSSKPKASKVLADGTYASQSAHVAEVLTPHVAMARQYPLRGLLLAGDYFLGCSLCNALTKLALKVRHLQLKPTIKNSIVGRVLLIMASIMAYGRSPHAPVPIDQDSYHRISTCIRVLTSPNPHVERLLLEKSHQSLIKFLSEKKSALDRHKKDNAVSVQVDDAIFVQQLKAHKAGPVGDFVEDAEEDLDRDVSKAAGGDKKSGSLEQPRIHQLTGYSDPIYAEVNLVVHQFDILFDIMVFNQTRDTLQNVSLELSTVGDLKLVDRPQTYTIGPNDCIAIRANIKVSSTETGIIFGNIVYDVAGSASVDSNCVVLNDIHIDIMDYIYPAVCTEAEFRAMWAEFEWENKVAVHTNVSDVRQYLNHIMKSTNMNCLTPSAMVGDDCGFLAANLYAKSVFGEHALLNLGIERQPNGNIAGHVRIRSKTQGIALSLGDKITQNQRVALP